MRNMSFSITTPQFKAGEKDVTRRWGWYNAKPGDRYRAVEKAMGLKKGEKIVELGIIEVISVEQEPLADLLNFASAYPEIEMKREGFAGTDPSDFVNMLLDIKPKTCRQPHPMRIEFRVIKEDK